VLPKLQKSPQRSVGLVLLLAPSHSWACFSLLGRAVCASAISRGVSRRTGGGSRSIRGEESYRHEATGPKADSTRHRRFSQYWLGVGLLGGLAIIIGVMALVKQESRPPAIAAIGLGTSAVLFQFFVWYAVALLGVLLIAGVLKNFEGFFENLFGG
jgi:hypothetical protein